MERIGDWMTTYTGRQFWPLDPRPEDVCIEDIAHALSMICRFGGHCRKFYSVAQHSCYVASLIPGPEKDGTSLAALMHDAAEAYVGDLIRPIKRSFTPYHQVEAKVDAAIRQRFGLACIPEIIKWADNAMLKNEHRDMIDDGMTWEVDAGDYPRIDVIPIQPGDAESLFLWAFRRYGGTV